MTAGVQIDVTRAPPGPVTIGPVVLVVLVVLAVWLVVSAVTAVGCAAVLRGGVEEDRARGYLTDRS